MTSYFNETDICNGFLINKVALRSHQQLDVVDVLIVNLLAIENLKNDGHYI